MALTYVSGGWERSYADLCNDRAVAFIDPRFEIGADALGQRLRPLLKELLAELIVVRGSAPDFVEQMERDPVLPEAIGAVPVFGLAGSEDSEARAPRLWQPRWAKQGVAPSLGDLRQAELHSILERSGAVRRADGFHFILPSGWHADEFVRLGDALGDSIDVVRICDWILERVEDRTTLIGDTGSINALLFAVQSEAQRRFGFDVRLANLSEYPCNHPAMKYLITELQGAQPSPLLLVLSVRSSGTLEAMFRSLAPEGSDVLTVCATGEEIGDALVQRPIERWSAEDGASCEQCEALHPLFIDPSGYQVLPVRGVTRVPFDRVLATQNEDFWVAVDQSGAIRLHANEDVPTGPHKGSRHMGIDIDMSRLLSKSDYLSDKVEAELSAIEAPDLVLIPDHRAGDVLNEIVEGAYPQSTPVIGRIRDSGLDEDLRRKVREAQRILILDDAAITANTLVHLRREIYRERADAASLPEVRALVALARPSHSHGLDFVRRNYGQRVDEEGAVGDCFSAAETILMPHHRDCPWCSERKTLSVLRSLPGVPAETQARIAELDSVDGANDARVLRATQRDGETQGSFLGTLSPDVAFAASAAVAHAQCLELEAKRQGAQLAVMDCSLSFEAFYDHAIVAGIFRTVPPRYLRNPEADAAITKLLLEEGSALGTDCLIELAWAAVTERLPREPVRELIVRQDDPPELLQTYRKILDVQTRSTVSTKSESGTQEEPHPRA